MVVRSSGKHSLYIILAITEDDPVPLWTSILLTCDGFDLNTLDNWLLNSARSVVEDIVERARVNGIHRLLNVRHCGSIRKNCLLNRI
jgi:hypothetical protein